MKQSYIILEFLFFWALGQIFGESVVSLAINVTSYGTRQRKKRYDAVLAEME